VDSMGGIGACPLQFRQPLGLARGRRRPAECHAGLFAIGAGVRPYALACVPPAFAAAVSQAKLARPLAALAGSRAAGCLGQKGARSRIDSWRDWPGATGATPCKAAWLCSNQRRPTDQHPTPQAPPLPALARPATSALQAVTHARSPARARGISEGRGRCAAATLELRDSPRS